MQTEQATRDWNGVAPASYDSRGVRYEWRPNAGFGERLALDVEALDTPLPEEGLFGCESSGDFFRAWTRLEVIAKLVGEPILLTLKRLPMRIPLPGTTEMIRLSNSQLELHYVDWPEHQLVFACGVHRTDSTPDGMPGDSSP